MAGLDDILSQEEGEGNTSPETTETGKTEEVVQDEKAADGEEGKVVDGTEGEKKDETPPVVDAAIPPTAEELNELRQFIRAQRKEMAAMQAKLSRMKSNDAVDDDGKPIVVYSELEKLQMELHNVAVTKTPVLEVLVEAMAANPRYEDIYEVCTKSHFDDIFEMAAANISRQEGKDFNEVLVQLELEVWKKPNPYKYMYSIIKTNHPKYKGKETSVTETKAKEETTTAKKTLEAKLAPGSVAAAGGGADLKSGSGWTSAKIDSMSESELHSVPKDVYDKYMKGQLK